ncbi:hypothetical protein SAMN05444340_13019, partial [Citreimonas salinaria]
MERNHGAREHQGHHGHDHHASAAKQPEPGKAIDPVCGMSVTMET